MYFPDQIAMLFSVECESPPIVLRLEAELSILVQSIGCVTGGRSRVGKLLKPKSGFVENLTHLVSEGVSPCLGHPVPRRLG